MSNRKILGASDSDGSRILKVFALFVQPFRPCFDLKSTFPTCFRWRIFSFFLVLPNNSVYCFAAAAAKRRKIYCKKWEIFIFFWVCSMVLLPELLFALLQFRITLLLLVGLVVFVSRIFIGALAVARPVHWGLCALLVSLWERQQSSKQKDESSQDLPLKVKGNALDG